METPITINSSNVEILMRKAIKTLKANDTLTINPWMDSWITCTGTGYVGSSLTDNNKTNMKIGKQTRFDITLVETVVKEHEYTVFAESKEQALEMIEKGGQERYTEVVSTEIIEKI